MKLPLYLLLTQTLGHLTSASHSTTLLKFTFIFTIQCILHNGALSTHTDSKWPVEFLYTPCTFPVPSGATQDEHRRICNANRHVPFVCDIHNALATPSGYYSIGRTYAKHKSVLLTDNGTSLIGVLIARQLASPISTEFVTKDSHEFGCLFHMPCQEMTSETIQKFVESVRTFTKVFTSALFQRWFQRPQPVACRKPRVLALVLIDGILSDPRKFTSVTLYSDDHLLTPFISNIALEATNGLLQGVPVSEVIADLIDQIGYAIRDYYATNGRHRRHPIPYWAWLLASASVLVVIIALLIEWYIVRRKLVHGKSPTQQSDGVRSKTHMIF